MLWQDLGWMLQQFKQKASHQGILWRLVIMPTGLKRYNAPLRSCQQQAHLAQFKSRLAQASWELPWNMEFTFLTLAKRVFANYVWQKSGVEQCWMWTTEQSSMRQDTKC